MYSPRTEGLGGMLHTGPILHGDRKVDRQASTTAVNGLRLSGSVARAVQ